MIAKVEELLAKAEAPDYLTLTQLGMSLREKLEVIKSLDREILELVKEDDLVDKIDQADLYKEKFYSTLIKIDGITAIIAKPLLSAAKDTAVAATPHASSPTHTHKVRLPKLTIKPFSGNVTM